jgi:hypothetical protein
MKEAGFDSICGRGTTMIHQNIMKEQSQSPSGSLRSKSSRKVTHVTNQTNKIRGSRNDFAQGMTITVEDYKGNVNDFVPGETQTPKTFGQGADQDSRDPSMFDSDRPADDHSPRP